MSRALNIPPFKVPAVSGTVMEDYSWSGKLTKMPSDAAIVMPVLWHSEYLARRGISSSTYRAPSNYFGKSGTLLRLPRVVVVPNEIFAFVVEQIGESVLDENNIIVMSSDDPPAPEPLEAPGDADFFTTVPNMFGFPVSAYSLGGPVAVQFPGGLSDVLDFIDPPCTDEGPGLSHYEDFPGGDPSITYWLTGEVDPDTFIGGEAVCFVLTNMANFGGNATVGTIEINTWVPAEGG